MIFVQSLDMDDVHDCITKKCKRVKSLEMVYDGDNVVGVTGFGNIVKNSTAPEIYYKYKKKIFIKIVLGRKTINEYVVEIMVYEQPETPQHSNNEINYVITAGAFTYPPTPPETKHTIRNRVSEMLRESLAKIMNKEKTPDAVYIRKKINMVVPKDDDAEVYLSGRYTLCYE